VSELFRFEMNPWELVLRGSAMYWFLYLLFVSFAVAYVCGQTLRGGAPFLSVFKIAGVVAFAAYSFAQIPNAIWWGRPWKSAFKEVADGAVYALLTGATFAALWPK